MPYLKTIFRFFIFILICLPAKAQFSGLAFDHFGINEGLSQSTVNALLQDSTGFIWIGTQDGLNRFDGKRFRVYKEGNGLPESASNFIHTLILSNGQVVAGTEDGLITYDAILDQFIRVPFSNSRSSGIFSVCSITDGLLVSSTEGEVFFIRNFNEKGQKIASPSSIPLKLFKHGKSIIAGNTDGLWLFKGGAFSGLELPHGGFTLQDIYCSEHDRDPIFVSGNSGIWKKEKGGSWQKVFSLAASKLFVDQTGNLWMSSEPGLGKHSLKTGKTDWYRYSPLNPRGLSSNRILSIMEDRSGSLWIGTESGLNKLDQNQNAFRLWLQRSNFQNANASTSVWCIYESADKILYAGTNDGLLKIRPQHNYPLLIQPGAQGSTNSPVHCLFPEPGGKIWAGSENGLYILEKEALKPALLPGSFRNWGEKKYITSMVGDPSGRLWIGTKNGLLILSADRSSCLEIPIDPNGKNGIPTQIVRCLYADSGGQIWVGTGGSGLCIISEKGGRFHYETLRHHKEKTGLSSDQIRCITGVSDGSLMIGTFGGGIDQFHPKSKKWKNFSERDGLCNNTVYGILEGKPGQIWASTNNGLSRIDYREGSIRNFFERDGLQSNEFNSGAYYKSQDGELFFGGINGLNSFFPEQIISNKLKPGIALTGFRLFNRTLSAGKDSTLEKSILLSDTLVLNYRQNFFTIEYAALHFTSPESNEFRVKMEGFDDESKPIITRNTEAQFTALPPGEYLFKVWAANPDGVWNEHSRDLFIIIEPPFWKTTWFRIALGLLVVLISYQVWRYRQRAVSRQRKALERQIRERTGKILAQKEEIETQKALLEKEKEKADNLLLNILPYETAEELKSKGKASARSYSLSTVMFTDFSGFTYFAEKMRPKELVERLDFFFGKFDEIIEKYNLEKIKTIGDSYMCVGGVPIRNKSNPVDAVLAGLKIQKLVKDTQDDLPEELRWKLRIGINTGELIAGVIGKKRFAYDIWGDTVNIAARLESSGEEGKVNISNRTFEYVKEFFVCQKRGRVKAKNKGEIDMFFVERIKPELSADEEGIEPNDEFLKRLNQILIEKFNYKKSEQHIIKLLKDNLPEDLYYHGLHHTLDVANAAEQIALAEGVEGEDLFLLKTAALFHDAGFTRAYSKNEPIGVMLAAQNLPQFGYNEKQIETISALIMATEIPQNPKTHLEEIMCDADLDYLGRDDFHEISNNLKLELMARGIVKGERHWDEIQVSFLEKHRYFTRFSRENREPHKQQRLVEIKWRLIENEYGS
jgi:ligand-binding sensor domain-containing protein/class 3 adenylate cyclase/predicted metal-dependent HD superfamily phosphohydrolase